MTANAMPPIPPIGPTTGMAPAQASTRFKPVDPVRVMRRNVLPLVLATGIGLALGAGAFFFLKASKPVFTSEGQLQASQIDAKDVVVSGPTGNNDQLRAYIGGQVQLLQSEALLREALKQPALQQTTWYENIADRTEPQQVAALREALAVSPKSGTNLIQIAANSSNPEDPATLLESVISALMAYQVAQSQVVAIEDRVILVQAQSNTTNQIANLIRSRDSLVSGQNVPERITETQEWAQVRFATQMRNEAQEALSLAESYAAQLQRQMAEGTLTPTTQDILIVENSSRVRAIDADIDGLLRQKEASLEAYGERHHVIRQIDAQIAAARARRNTVYDEEMRKQLANKVEQSGTAVESLRGALADAEETLATANDALTDKQRLIYELQQYNADIEIARAELIEIEDRIELVDTVERNQGSMQTERFRDPESARMTFPGLWLIPLAGVGLFGLTLGLLLLKDVLDQKVRSPQDLRTVPQAESLGVIPSAADDPSGLKSIEGAVQASPTGLIAESFRQMRTGILGKMDRRGYKSLVVCGAQGGAGVSSLIQNLAASVAYNGRNVLVVDANFRRPAQHKLFGVANGQGLISYLSGENTDLDDLVRKSEDGLVSVLPVGPVDQAQPELIERPSFRKLLGELETQYDLILIDVAPALLTSEAQLVVKYVDSVAAVIRADQDHRGMVERLLNRLDGQRADLLGVILNGVRSSAGGYFRKNYEDFYRYNSPQRNGASRSSRAAARETVDAE